MSSTATTVHRLTAQVPYFFPIGGGDRDVVHPTLDIAFEQVGPEDFTVLSVNIIDWDHHAYNLDDLKEQTQEWMDDDGFHLAGSVVEEQARKAEAA
jgi:hypothetical protein